MRIVLLLALVIQAIPAHAEFLEIPSNANIYGASHLAPPNPGGGDAGVLPPLLTFDASPGTVITFSKIVGQATLTTEFGLNGPDGSSLVETDLSSFNGISGIKADVSGFLVGVFVGPAEAADPAPPVLDFSSGGLGTSFTTLSPALGQVFFIGDGLTGTGTGARQQFVVPGTATRLYLGLADGATYQGPPGQYQDNGGSFITIPCIGLSLSVPATANIYGAGHATAPNPGGGSAGGLPPFASFIAGPGRVLSFSGVAGMATLTTAFGLNGPDGSASIPTSISSFGGISGITANSHGFLAGVFLGPDEPSDPSPPVLHFGPSGIGTSFGTLSPALGQTFFIGDGLTGTGSGTPQEFMVPSEATRLYLGFADGFTYSGPPGQYQDNSGSFTATFSLCSDFATAAVDPVDGDRVMSFEGAPNPFQHSTSLRFVLPVSRNVTLDVIDLAGRRVRRLVSGTMDAGFHSVDWNGTDHAGQPVGAGAYFVLLQSGEQRVQSKIVLLR